ncbi:hypothetical protein ELQ92_05010 [Labedella populi]|uniref:Uncharacterized protein n=1 Tax=Labedella populi TaxID=2498850 RepID=A0A444QG86_9MICO|nr:hypothetical protein [Labedella populi]RWZ68565.1 hypothetical protein ELQ92_05010 [Labedella populi]
MRWDDLFDDLESQLATERDAEERDERADEERRRIGRLLLRERVEALAIGARGGASVTIELGAERLVMRPTTIGRDWVSGETSVAGARSRGCIVPVAAITGVIIPPGDVVRSLSVLSSAGAPRVSDRIGFAFVLRDLCRRRVTTEVHTVGGVRTGTIDRVGRDHLDLAVHEFGEARRHRNVADILLLPFAAVRRILI